ncbi:MAG: GNAT family N-acetyltransferase [Gemmatimonadota bacterium]
MRLDAGLAILRPWKPGDRAALVRHANDREIWRNLRDRFPHPYTDADADRWLEYACGREPEQEWVLAIDVAGEAIGCMTIARQPDHPTTAELGYWLGRAFWGRGIATAAVRTLSDRALAEPDIYRLEAGVFSWNPASVRVLEKAGFVREAALRRAVLKDGVLLDRLLYARTRDPGIPYLPAT